MGPKNGVLIEQVQTPDRYGRLDVAIEVDKHKAWTIQSSNVQRFRIMRYAFGETIPQAITIDHKSIVVDAATEDICFVRDLHDEWSSQHCEMIDDGRVGRQRGTLDAIMRTTGPLQITASEHHMQLASQISRNLLQYFGADSSIKDIRLRGQALSSNGNVISLTTTRGSNVLPSTMDSFPVAFDDHGIRLCPKQSACRSFTYDTIAGAIILRPLQQQRLEVLVWGCDLVGLQTAARLLPTLTGVGQPDFILLGPTSRWQGLQGALALGFFDHSWNISQASYY